VYTENSILIGYVTETPNVSVDDRAALLLPDPIHLALQVRQNGSRSNLPKHSPGMRPHATWSAIGTGSTGAAVTRRLRAVCLAQLGAGTKHVLPSAHITL